MAISNLDNNCNFPNCTCPSLGLCGIGERQVTKPQREGDQAPPVPNQLPAIQDLVMRDLQERKAIGIKRYGTALQPHNGRDALLDAYEEAQDLCMYLRQAIYERDGK